MWSVPAQDRETLRVAEHIRRAERFVRERPRPRADRASSLLRRILLRELRAYRRAGVFPKNRDFADRATPYFIDADGTRCAMAHLMELGGAAALVARIARERNNAFVRELADEPELLAWLDAAGLSVDDAARIQPTYCADRRNPICGHPSNPIVGALDVTMIEDKTGAHPSRGRVDAVHGDTAVRVGTEIAVAPRRAPGTQVLAKVYRSQATDTGESLTFAGETVWCEREAGAPELRITRSQAVDAITSGDCRAAVAALDPWWTADCDRTSSVPAMPMEGPCSASPLSSSPAREGDLDGRGGCSTAATEGSHATMQILLALLGVMTARRLARARANRLPGREPEATAHGRR
ncbi:MAG: hypothetical protein KF819_37970 [Labilithrix sp.]|nr:hypothetical protein [Labilithrix sp.]